MILGIIHEGKVPVDHRTPLTPDQAKSVTESHPEVEVIVQSSDVRCFSDEAYQQAGIRVVDTLDEADVILGVKEVPLDQLLTSKTYFFFSHTIKAQAYNRKLLQTVLDRNIRLVDYETLTDEAGRRVIAFGRWAGIVGAYNGLWTYGKRYNLYSIRRAHECHDLEDLKTEFEKIQLPKIRIVITGGGRVARGAMEVLNGVGIRRVSPSDFLREDFFPEPVYTQLNSRDYHEHVDGETFNRHEFYQHPERYKGSFLPFANKAEILIAAAYWDPDSPVLFTVPDALGRDFQLKVIADITCDIEGSIPSTKAPSTIEDPVYDFNPTENTMEAAFGDEGNLTVMAVDNLPCELPRDASRSFGEQLLANVLPHFLTDPHHDLINRATIAENGALGANYTYLTSFIQEGDR